VTARRRSLGLVAAALAATLGATGCNSSPGAAALVGDDRISTETLQKTVDAALRDTQVAAAIGEDRAAFARTELGRIIANHVVAALAAQHHVTASDSEITQTIAQFAQQSGGEDQLYQQAATQGGISKSEFRTVIRYYVLEQKVGDDLVADTPVSQEQLQAAYDKNIADYATVHAAHILVTSKKQADRILAQVESKPSRFAALAAKFSTDTGSKDSGGDLGVTAASGFVPEFAAAVVKAKVGSFVEVHSQFGWHVVQLISRKLTPLAKAAPDLKSQILSDTRTALLDKALRAESARLGVHVSPRYGRWDVAQQTVVARPDPLSTPAPAGG
jgi:parvulin-like peptidyl-prolyl isomerase